MQYKLNSPCDECPFVEGSGFSVKRLSEFASGEFPCHKQCDLDDDGVFVEKTNGKTNHCAGALLFCEQQDAPHQMMRIAERLGFYDRSQLCTTRPIVSPWEHTNE